MVDIALDPNMYYSVMSTADVGVDARVHQHAEIGRGEVPFDHVFDTLRDIGFDGVISVCVFGWHEDADNINRRMLARIQSEFSA
jgi:myo-inositol catabolism protein IolH